MMTQNEIQSIRASIGLLSGRTEEFAALFYDRLFTIRPDLRLMFRGDMTAQGRKLMDAILVLSASLDRFPALQPTLRHLKARHASYGVQPEHYQVVATALLHTLHNFAGSEFNRTLQQAWANLLHLVSTEMMAGAEQALTVKATR